jgi:hypothetical protein
VVQRPDSLRRPGCTGGADGGRDARGDVGSHGRLAQARPRARLLDRSRSRLRDHRRRIGFACSTSPRGSVVRRSRGRS